MTRYLEIRSGSISEVANKLREDYDAYFKKELEKEGKSLASMTDAEKKAFFNRVDKGYNAKSEATSQDVSPSLANKTPEKSKTTLVAAPGNKEKVIRIPVEKLADYKAKGYVEAESFVPEAANEPYAIGMAAAMKSTGDTPPLKKSTITKAHDIAKKVKEEELTAGQKKLPPALQKAIEKKDKKEEVKLEDKDSGGIDALRAIKGKRQRLEQELERLNKDDASYKEKAANLRGQIEKQKEIMASKQKEVYGSYDPSREDALDLNEITDEEENINEAGMKEIDTTNQEIKRLRVRLQQLRDSENAAAGGDTTNIEKQIHQTRSALLDLQKKALDKKVDVKEGKMTYKSYKKSMKKEENPKNMKTTLTGQPVTKIDVEPKLPNHN